MAAASLCCLTPVKMYSALDVGRWLTAAVLSACKSPLMLPVVPVIAPDARQQPVHVEDVAAAIVACVATPATAGQVYALSGAAPVTFEALVRQTIQATGHRRWVVRLPFWPVRLGVMLYNACVPRPRVTVEQVERLREDKAFDHDAAERDFGYRPRTFADGVAAEARLVR